MHLESSPYLQYLQQKVYEKEDPQLTIAAAQFTLNPGEAAEVVVNDFDQYDPAKLILGHSSTLIPSITSTSLKILSLFNVAEPFNDGVAIKGEPLDKVYCCVVRPYSKGFPTQEINHCIVLPKVKPQPNRNINLSYGRDVQRVYELHFDLLLDDNGCLAYFGNSGVMPIEQAEIIMGRK